MSRSMADGAVVALVAAPGLRSSPKAALLVLLPSVIGEGAPASEAPMVSRVECCCNLPPVNVLVHEPVEGAARDPHGAQPQANAVHAPAPHLVQSRAFHADRHALCLAAPLAQPPLTAVAGPHNVRVEAIRASVEGRWLWQKPRPHRDESLALARIAHAAASVAFQRAAWAHVEGATAAVPELPLLPTALARARCHLPQAGPLMPAFYIVRHGPCKPGLAGATCGVGPGIPGPTDARDHRKPSLLLNVVQSLWVEVAVGQQPIHHALVAEVAATELSWATWHA
jgi:hypothetical protein